MAWDKHFGLDGFVFFKRVQLADWRLALLHRSLQLAVVIYIAVWQLAALHQYAEFEPASPYINIWAANAPAAPTTVPSFCSNPAYDWGMNFNAEERQITGGIQYFDMSCVRFNRARHMVSSSNSFTAVTAEMREYPNGTINRVFTDAPEASMFNAIHLFSASWLSEGVVCPAVSIRTKSGELLASFADGAVLGGLPLADWIRFAGSGLDHRNIQPWIRGGVPSESPFYRVTGMVLLVRVQYSNLRLGELPTLNPRGVPQADITVEVLPTAWGYLGTDTVFDEASGQTVAVTRTGVTVQFVFSGEVGRFSASELIRRLIEAIVLLGAAAFVTELAMRMWLYRLHFEGFAVETVRPGTLQAAGEAPAGVKGQEDKPGAGLSATTGPTSPAALTVRSPAGAAQQNAGAAATSVGCGPVLARLGAVAARLRPGSGSAGPASPRVAP